MGMTKYLITLEELCMKGPLMKGLLALVAQAAAFSSLEPPECTPPGYESNLFRVCRP